MASSKDVPFIIDYLNKKWVHYVDGQLAYIATGPIRLFPMYEQGRDHAGWGKEDSGITAGSMYQLLGRPDIIRLEYAWMPKVCVACLKPHSLSNPPTRDLANMTT